VSYEFVYYWWHRAMHVSPILYKWVHRLPRL
jgi:sterol desaturase/sphingolipid hydroxylase (fatty acid hydroxylase superfamily)